MPISTGEAGLMCAFYLVLSLWALPLLALTGLRCCGGGIGVRHPWTRIGSVRCGTNGAGWRRKIAHTECGIMTDAQTTGARV